MKTNLEEESDKINQRQLEYIAIVTNRYEQEMKKAISNIQYELEKGYTPYLGKDLITNIIEDSLTIIDLTKQE